MRTNRIVSGAVLAVLLLSGCATSSAALPTSVPATSLPAATAAPTAVPTAVPTATPLPTATPSPTAVPTATPVPNPLTDPTTRRVGMPRGSVTTRPEIVMIDNHPDAYPQTNVDQAAVVFEALAEYGVTRFMAVYVPGITPDLDVIGPVRSTRLYFAQWAMGFHALYAHAGGSPGGLQLVESTTELINLDALKKPLVNFFYRSKDRVAPHNLYTSSALLAKAATALDATPYTNSEIGFLYKDEAPATARGTSQELSYFFLYPNDPAGWIYDTETNGYYRTRRGRAARDAVSGNQLWTKNVVVMEVQERKIAGDEKGRIEQDVIGEGVARVFQDGISRDITWRKADPTAPLLFFESDGTEVRFNAGPLWIAALPDIGNLTVQ